MACVAVEVVKMMTGVVGKKESAMVIKSLQHERDWGGCIDDNNEEE